MRKLILLFLSIIGLQTYGQELIEETYQNKANTKLVAKKRAYYHNQTFLSEDSIYTKKRFYAKTGEQIYENNYKSLSPEIRHGRQISFKEKDTTYFDNGVPTGIWNVTDFFKGKRMILNYNFKMIYSENEIQSNLPYDQINKHLEDLDKKPQFKDEYIDFIKYIYENRYLDIFNLGKAILEIEKPAIVKLSFEIDSNGKVNNIKVNKSIHPIYDKEAVRLIKESPDWVPSENEGEKVTTKMYSWIHFERIQGSE